jgi:riboflavin kinase/FMN adenylyltransferase
MKIYHSLDDIPYNDRTALTIGTFDGVHRGHRAIIDALTRIAAEIGGRSVVLTFHPHPQEVLRKHGDSVPILSTIDERAAELEKLGVDALLVLEFTMQTAATTWQEFCDALIEKVGLAHIVVGHDHAFGKGREGTVTALTGYGRTHGFDVTEIRPLQSGEETISSTKIRRALLGGELERANDYLGRPFAVTGRIVRGDGRGRTIGIPTANVEPLDATKLVPVNGVYCVTMHIDDIQARGMANIGVRPTFTDGSRRTLEVHLFDFDADIYDRIVTVEFRKFVRSEQKFASKEEFLAQLERDREACS